MSLDLYNHCDWTIKDKLHSDNSLFRTDEAVTRRQKRLQEVSREIRRLLFKDWSEEPSNHPVPLLKNELHQKLNQITEIAPVSVEIMWDCLDYLIGCGYIEFNFDSNQICRDLMGYTFKLTDEEENGESMDFIERDE